MKSDRIRSYSGPHFPVFGLNMERYGVSLRIQSECEKMWTRITPNTDTFHAVECSWFKFNNLGLALGMSLTFYTSLEKGLKLKVRKF